MSREPARRATARVARTRTREGVHFHRLLVGATLAVALQAVPSRFPSPYLDGHPIITHTGSYITIVVCSFYDDNLRYLIGTLSQALERHLNEKKEAHEPSSTSLAT